MQRCRGWGPAPCKGKGAGDRRLALSKDEQIRDKTHARVTGDKNYARAQVIGNKTHARVWRGR